MRKPILVTFALVVFIPLASNSGQAYQTRNADGYYCDTMSEKESELSHELHLNNVKDSLIKYQQRKIDSLSGIIQ